MAIELRRLTKPRSSRISLHSTDSGDELRRAPRRSIFSSGWKSGLLFGASSCLLVFAINLGVTIWSTTLPEGDADENHIRRILKEGSCSEIRKYNVALHLAINVFSSILLAASNYCMQCLSAPTRADIDKAHFRGKWMDIGIPSLRNLVDVPRKRAVLWGLLVLSSVPLHLFYNSVVFSSLSTVDYIVGIVNETDSADSTFSLTFNEANRTSEFQYHRHMQYHPDMSSYSEYLEDLKNLWNSARNDELQNLTTSECINKYATAFQTSRGHVLLVGEPGFDPDWQGIPFLKRAVIFQASTGSDAYSWICSNAWIEETCRGSLPTIKKQADDWRPFDTRIKYCLSKREKERCRLNFSPPLVAIVLVSNALKAAILLYTALRPPDEPLFVLGDAIESYLTSPDAFSSDSCLVSADDLRNGIKNDWTGPREWFPVKRRWATAVTKRRWMISMLLYLAALGVSLFYLIRGIVGLAGPKDFKSLWNLGFGAVTEVALIQKDDTPFRFNNAKIILNILVANIPQFLFSILYFQYNALFTGMLAAKEWSDFGYKRKGLRVSSDPKGDQRSRYFLQLPYRWSVPLLFMSILIHWMLSQSIFVVAVEKPEDSEDATLYSTCGYSPIAIIAVVLTSGVLVLAVVITGFRRLPAAIPVVGSCSLAIAAACHHPNGLAQPDEPLVPLRWGVMGSCGEAPDEGGVGHCGFSSEYVDEPQVGIKYS
ncbi:hypothetical protein EDB81DRAFT_286349 [Dactylonectria macrodidyma]|uniref:DUF6536 domain-containing protein n=1 Tax=Dactylonectria macrodidyma TaxID=307937 RepID=A0A9P9DAE8_9HYPO|nr:hypothetical protein EDB81DRAFT_286349 [Dactylonectria macrodidyma]